MSQPYLVARRSQPLRNKRRLLKIGIFSFIAVIIMGGTAYAVLFSGALRVRAVNISGIERIDETALRSSAYAYLGNPIYGLIGRDNYLFIDNDNIASYLAEKFPEAASISVTKQFPPVINIIVRERHQAGIWCSRANGECFDIDTNGTLYESAAMVSGTLLLKLTESRAAGIGDGVISAENLVTLRSMNDIIRNRFGLAANSYAIDGMPDVTVSLFDGRTLFFDISRPQEENFHSLQVALDNLNFSGEAVTYIDLRVPGKAYYDPIKPETGVGAPK
jgi:hypothetical protein